MIDFRYHLVSLISVFLALAVGIVLGAGPLQGPIGSSLTSQVDGLRADRDQLRTELDVSRSETQQTAALVEATASDLVADSLTDRTIVLVRTAGADNDQADAMSARIEEAGGRVVSDLNLTETTFAAPDAELVTALREADASLPEDDGAAVTQGLARAFATQPAADDSDDEGSASPAPEADATEAPEDEADSEARDASEALFTALSDAGRIERGEWSEADAVVLLAPDVAPEATPDPTPSGSASPESAEDRSAAVQALAGFSAALAGQTTTVVAGPTASASVGLLADLRSDRVDLSTVDGTDLATGPVLVPLVTQAALDGEFGDFGTAQGATAVLPDTAQ